MEKLDKEVILYVNLPIQHVSCSRQPVTVSAIDRMSLA